VASLFVGDGYIHKTVFIGRKEKALRRKGFFFFMDVYIVPSTSAIVRLTIRYEYKRLAP
jgi:hypothetical protein